MRLRTILVPTDFGPSSNEALKYAKVLAERFHARLHLLHVVSVPYLYDAWGTEAIAMQAVNLQNQLDRDARRQLNALVPRSGPLAKRVTTSIADGATVESLLDCIRAKHIDLVVMGTHGRSPMGHVLLGSVAERIVRHSPVPVLTMHEATAKTPRRRTPRGH
jgi:nucleotide-binding universal stress UspA family protein